MPPKQPPQHGSSQASSSHHAAGPTHSYYEICKHLADNIPEKFSVGREMSVVAETFPPDGRGPSVSLWVQARNHRDPNPTRKSWVVVTHPDMVYEIQRLVRRGLPDGPRGSRAILTEHSDESSDALFQFRENKNKHKTDELPRGTLIPEPEPPNVIITGPDHHLASLAEFLFKDVLFETWEARKADRKFWAVNKHPKYSLLFSETYWMVKDGKRTKKVNIALYLSKDEAYQGKDNEDVSIILNKHLLGLLVTNAKNGPGEPGMHHQQKGHFLWQLVEDVRKKNFKPEPLLNDSSSSSSSSTSPEPSSSSSGASPGPGPGPGPGPSQKRGHSRSGSDAADSKKPKKDGTSSTFGPRPQGASASGSHQPSGSASHSASTSAPHTSSQHSSQHNLSEKVDKHLKI
jgi:hypothetical protein